MNEEKKLIIEKIKSKGFSIISKDTILYISKDNIVLFDVEFEKLSEVYIKNYINKRINEIKVETKQNILSERKEVLFYEMSLLDSINNMMNNQYVL